MRLRPPGGDIPTTPKPASGKHPQWLYLPLPRTRSLRICHEMGMVGSTIEGKNNMFQADHAQFENAKIDGTLHNFLPGMQTAVSTPLADALIAAIKIDIRRSGVSSPEPTLLALDFDKVFELGWQLNYALETRGHEFCLPFGSVVRGVEPGCVEVAGEAMTLDVDRPGLHAVETTSRHARGSNLELLRSNIERLTRKLACRRIGLPSPHHIVDTDSRPLLQFPPFAEAGDVVLQRSAYETGAVRFCAASPKQIAEFAGSIVADMKALWKLRKAVAPRVIAVRREAEKAAAALPVPATVRSIDITMEHQRDVTDFCLYVEYNAIDEAMRDGIVLDFVPSRDRIEDGLFRTPWSLAGRWIERAKLRALGADGMIDEMALCILEAAPEGASAVLARLTDSYETQVTIPTDAAPVFATLFWRDGCIDAEISAAQLLDWCGTKLELYGLGMSEAEADAFGGLRVCDIATLPFGCACVISSSSGLNDGGTRLSIDPERKLIDLATGRTWAVPTGF